MEKINSKFEVSAEFIIQAHSQASTEAQKKEIEKQFPGIFKYVKAYEFQGEDVVLSGRDENGEIVINNHDVPFFLGKGLAPEALYKKCLIVDYGWRAVVLKSEDSPWNFNKLLENDRQIIYFERK